MVSLAEKTAAATTRAELACILDTNNPSLQNFALSVWEKVHGQTQLESFPWNITIPVADLCNARCNFCTSWLEGRKVIELEQLDLFEEVLRRALFIGLVGHGEPLAHPRFDAICDRLESFLGRPSSCYTITNGALLQKWRDRLPKINLHSYSISLNAATAETHHAIMGLGEDAFPRIVESIGELTATKSRGVLNNNVYITMVVTKDNIAEVPKFIELGNKLRVTQIVIRSLLPQAHLIPGLNYHLLPPYEHPDFDKLRRNAFAARYHSSVPVEIDPGSWSNPIFTPEVASYIAASPPDIVERSQALRDRESRTRNDHLYATPARSFLGQADTSARDEYAFGNPYERTPPYSCKAPYYNLFINEMFFRMVPCCFIQNVPGHQEIRFDGSFEFMEAWNSPAMMNLRSTLQDGPLYGACKRCPERW